MNNSGIGRPFNRRLVILLTGGFLILALFGFLVMMVTNNPYDARRAAAEAKRLEELKAQPAGDAKVAKNMTAKAEEDAQKQFEAEELLRKREKEEAERLRKKEFEEMMRKFGTPQAAAPQIDPALIEQMRRAQERAGSATAEMKFFESYGGESERRPLAGDGIAVQGMNYSINQVEGARGQNVPPSSSSPGATGYQKTQAQGAPAANGVQKGSWGADYGDQDAVAPIIKPKAPGDWQFLLSEGSVIKGVMVTGINTLNPGVVVARVTMDVYDSVTGRRLLIPRGSRLMGSYKPRPEGGDERVMVSFRRLLLPDGRSVELPAMPAIDAKGEPGVSGEYYSNLWKAVGPSAILGLISAAIEGRNQNNTVNVYGTYSGGGSNAASTIAQQTLPEVSKRMMGRQNGAIPYTIVDPGTEIMMIVTGDIAIPPNSTQAFLRAGE